MILSVRKVRKRTPKQNERIVKMLVLRGARGWGYARIARRFRVTTTAVHNLLVRFGVPKYDTRDSRIE